MGRYNTAAVALDFMHDDDAMISHALRLVPGDQVHLVHVVRMSGCPEPDEFEASCMEQEYFRCQSQLEEMGNASGIPKERQALLVGPVTERISKYVNTHGIDLLIIGNLTPLNATNYPVDVLSGALHSANCDLLVVHPS